MTVQQVPRCFGCREPVEADPIFAAPCDHEDCPSVVWHGLCLMEWRETRDRIVESFQRWAREHGG